MSVRDEGFAAVVIRCLECGRAWEARDEHWRTYLTDDDPPEALSYCPACAAREFDD
jgi:hypothetical protein